MKTATSKKLILFLICFGLLVLFYVKYSEEYEFSPKQAIQQNTLKATNIQQSSITIQQSSVESKIDMSKPMVIDGKGYYFFTTDEMNELKNWMTNKGYLKKGDLIVYESYTDNILIELTKNGDLAALNVLKTRAIEAHDSKAAKRYLMLAALYGSTPALLQLSQFAEPVYANDATEELRRPHVLEAVALKKVIELRGDHHLASVSREIFEKSYKILYKEDLVLSIDDQKYIDHRAHEIYDQLQVIRQQKGLGDFDNTEPDAVKKYTGAN